MLVFLDESFRTNKKTGEKFGLLSGIAIPEHEFASVQTAVFHIMKPYFGLVLKPDSELKGTELLRNATFKSRKTKGYSYHWNLVADLLNYCHSRRLRIFGVVCFRSDFQSFVCADEKRLDPTFQYLFERIDRYIKAEHPGRLAKLVFDNRDHQTHEKNARAITNFFARSSVGAGFDSILRVPFFAVSQGHNYGLQLADIVSTVIGLRFQSEEEIKPLWAIAQQMFWSYQNGDQTYSSLKVIRANSSA